MKRRLMLLGLAALPLAAIAQQGPGMTPPPPPPPGQPGTGPAPAPAMPGVRVAPELAASARGHEKSLRDRQRLRLVALLFG